MKLGVVGLPNVGKSTLFNALTQAGAQSANYPFCTIEPNYGIVSVPDARMDYLAQIYHPQKFTPAQIEFVDIAGLVKGASKGEGLGNKFLSHIREVDAIDQRNDNRRYGRKNQHSQFIFDRSPQESKHRPFRYPSRPSRQIQRSQESPVWTSGTQTSPLSRVRRL